MHKETIDQLNQLNNDFYNTVADSFNTSRNYYWSGWKKIGEEIKKQFGNKKIKVLDIGCGNGRFAQFLDESGVDFAYTGLDSSKKLLKWALEQVSLEQKTDFNHFDLIKSLQNNTFSQFLDNEKFDVIVCFGVLHHIPSFELRKKLFETINNDLLNNDGLFVITAWLFLDNPKLKERTLEMKAIKELGIESEDLEINDYLLDWQRGEQAIRYCHYADNAEVNELTKETHLKLISSYKADSKTNNLNQYYLFKRGK